MLFHLLGLCTEFWERTAGNLGLGVLIPIVGSVGTLSLQLSRAFFLVLTGGRIDRMVTIILETSCFILSINYSLVKNL